MQKQLVKKIADHIGTEIKQKELNKICKNIFYKKSSTFRKGIIGDWKNHFDNEHKELFKEKCGDTLIELGYEEDFNW